MRMKDKFAIGLVGLAAVLAGPQANSGDEGPPSVQTCPVISINDMHAIDFINCVMASAA